MPYLSRSRSALGLSLVLMASACPARPAPGPTATPEAMLDPTESGPLVAKAIQRGDYAEAVALTERTSLPKPELDQAVGSLILDALVDDQAVSRPARSHEDGLQRIEAAALAGDGEAAPTLRALFHTGLSTRGENVQLAPNAELETCWRRVEDGAGQAAACVEMRAGAGRK